MLLTASFSDTKQRFLNQIFFQSGCGRYVSTLSVFGKTILSLYYVSHKVSLVKENLVTNRQLLTILLKRNVINQALET